MTVGNGTVQRWRQGVLWSKEETSGKLWTVLTSVEFQSVKESKGCGMWGEERIDILANCHQVPRFDCFKPRNLHCRSTFHKCGICAVICGSVRHPVSSQPRRTGFEFKLARVRFMLVIRPVLLRVILLSPIAIFRRWSSLILHSSITDGI